MMEQESDYAWRNGWEDAGFGEIRGTIPVMVILLSSLVMAAVSALPAAALAFRTSPAVLFATSGACYAFHPARDQTGCVSTDLPRETLVWPLPSARIR